MKKITHRHRLILALMTLVAALSLTTTAYAHGVVISYTLKANGEVELLAEFDTGEPLAEAQVTVYSPEDPLTPWLTGTADAEGRYTFVIDPEQPGFWDIQFRTAGHGDIIHLQLDKDMVDPALLEHAPGQLLPDAATAGTTAAEAETGVEPEPMTRSEAALEVGPAETETAAQTAPDAAGPIQETGEVAVLSSGGNAGSTGGFTSLQILLMSASVIWGFVGTALYFSSKKTQTHDHAHEHHH